MGKKSKGEKKEKINKKSLTLQGIEEMSNSSLEDDTNDWNKEAKALKKAIEDGNFDCLLNNKDDKSESSIEEVTLDSDDEGEKEEKEEEEEEEETKIPNENEEKEEEEKEEEEEEEDEEDEEEDDDSDDEDSVDDRLSINNKALVAVTNDMLRLNKNMPWIEKCDITPKLSLRFDGSGMGTNNNVDSDDDDDNNVISIHDDLKREVLFYDVALEAVQSAKKNFNKLNIPVTRPIDFFAEMVKTDRHMAMVKDRLLFEKKKIDAVEQRKSNKEQKFRSKEARANQLAEKSRKRKQSIMESQNWAYEENARNSTNEFTIKKNNNNSGGRRSYWVDKDGEKQTGPNKKRMYADKKFGHGGKRGRFKNAGGNASLNDMTGYNRGGGGGGKKSKNNRPGKRARDAKRNAMN